MATSEKTVKVYTCDSGCGTERIGRDGERPPGIHLTITRRDTRVDTGDAPLEAFSCNVAHVRKAVEAVTVAHNLRALGEADETSAESEGLHDEEPADGESDDAPAAAEPAYV